MKVGSAWVSLVDTPGFTRKRLQVTCLCSATRAAALWATTTIFDKPRDARVFYVDRVVAPRLATTSTHRRRGWREGRWLARGAASA